MSAFVEVYVNGDHRAYIEAASVAGVLLPKGADGGQPATSGEPMTVILKGGETIPGVFGLTPDEFVFRCAAVRTILRTEPHRQAVVAYLDQAEDLRARLALILGGALGRAA